MKYLITIFFTGILFSCAQTKVFDQEYYSVIKNKSLEFKQVKDSLFLTKCNGFKKCDSLPKFSYFIEKDSIIDERTKVILVKGQKYKHRNTKVHDKGITIVEYGNGRKAIKESYNLNGNEKVQFVPLYPKSELENLKPISKISETESKEVLTEFLNYVKSFDKEEFNYGDYKTWEKFNELVINKGYNPIGAEREIGLKSD
jgi:hypothetical protein